MNEQIKQLAVQAKLWAMDNTNFPISSHIPAGYTEKLAELIVRECAHCVDFYTSDGNGPASAVILKHFGVEE